MAKESSLVQIGKYVQLPGFERGVSSIIYNTGQSGKILCISDM